MTQDRNFASIIKQLRKDCNITQRDLAQMIGIHDGYLSKIERGRFPPPSEKVILKLAEVFEVDGDHLLFLGGKTPSDLNPIITEGPYIPRILRQTKGLNKENWHKIEAFIQGLKESNDR